MIIYMKLRINIDSNKVLLIILAQFFVCVLEVTFVNLKEHFVINSMLLEMDLEA